MCAVTCVRCVYAERVRVSRGATERGCEGDCNVDVLGV